MYLEKFRLGGRTAVVTGAGQGIGLACAEALAEAGAKVVITDRDPAAANKGHASLKAKGHDAEIVIMDVTNSTRVAEVADQLVARYAVGSTRLSAQQLGTTFDEALQLGLKLKPVAHPSAPW